MTAVFAAGIDGVAKLFQSLRMLGRARVLTRSGDSIKEGIGEWGAQADRASADPDLTLVWILLAVAALVGVWGIWSQYRMAHAIPQE
jgi:hypothetical protein